MSVETKTTIELRMFLSEKSSTWGELEGVGGRRRKSIGTDVGK